MDTIEQCEKMISSNKRRKTDENDEISFTHKTKPVDLYHKILENIDKYSYMCDEEYAGPITKKEILAHVSHKRRLENEGSDSYSNKGRGSVPSAPVTIPISPKFKTDDRIALKEKKNNLSTEQLELLEIERLKQAIKDNIQANRKSLVHAKSSKGLERLNTENGNKQSKQIEFKEFNFQTEARSSRHSEFRKQNFEKLQEQKDYDKFKEEENKRKEVEKQKKMLKYYNNKAGVQENKQENGETQKFESLKNVLEKALMRTDDDKEVVAE